MSGSVGAICFLVAVLVTLPRWLRVSQREHYAPGRARWAAALWTITRPPNRWLFAAITVLGIVGIVVPVVGWVATLAAIVWPWGLSLWPKEKPLAFTARARRLAVVALAILLVLDALLWAVGAPAGLFAILVLTIPADVDLAAGLLEPFERRGAAKFAGSARAKLERVRPTVVAITGSYGKTSTKNYLAHLVAPARATVASPASFNNLAGLSRTVNEHLVPGTEVLIAEMGTYGPGEIRALCELFRPDVAAITVIGDAHLERMGSRATILAAKSEITELPGTVVLPVDQPELAELAARLASAKRVITCSVGAEPSGADVVLRDGVLFVHGDRVGEVALAANVHRLNVVVAVGLALALDVPLPVVVRQLGSLPDVGHRQVVATDSRGVTVIDDTYNANPTGARAAVDLLASRAKTAGGRAILVTPGMVELGVEQDEANTELARYAVSQGVELVVTGWTNRVALLAGAAAAGGSATTFPGRAAAVAWVSREAIGGDVVLYENDLPDHYP